MQTDCDCNCWKASPDCWETSKREDFYARLGLIAVCRPFPPEREQRHLWFQHERYLHGGFKDDADPE